MSMKRTRAGIHQTTGYHHCGCRDCFELTVGRKGDFCPECREAGCQPGHECRSEGAYGVEQAVS